MRTAFPPVLHKDFIQAEPDHLNSWSGSAHLILKRPLIEGLESRPANIFLEKP